MEWKLAGGDPSQKTGETGGGGAGGGRANGDYRGTVRLATASDFQAVMNINDNIYDGLDYMPIMFHPFVHSSAHRLYLYEENGQVVCLVNLRFHPDEEDLVTVASMRVHSSQEGRGLLSTHGPVFAHIMKQHPKVTRYIAYANFRSGLKARNTQMKITDRAYFLAFNELDRPNVERFARLGSRSATLHHPIDVSYSNGVRWINDSDRLVRFLSRYSDYIPHTCAWFPVRLNPGGLRQLISVSDACVTFRDGRGTAEGNSGNDDNTLVDLLKDDGRDLSGFSYSCCLRCPFGIYFDVQFFGDEAKALLGHVNRHLQHLVGRTDARSAVAVGIHFPPSIDPAEVEERLSEGLGRRWRNDYYNGNEIIQYFVELPKAKL